MKKLTVMLEGVEIRSAGVTEFHSMTTGDLMSLASLLSLISERKEIMFGFRDLEATSAITQIVGIVNVRKEREIESKRAQLKRRIEELSPQTELDRLKLELNDLEGR